MTSERTTVNDRWTVHAAKIPEGAREFTRGGRVQRGVEMVNACDNKPWVIKPEDVPVTMVDVCQRCKVLVEYTRARRD